MKTQPINGKKTHKGRLNPLWKTKQKLWQGEYGLMSLNEGRITAKEILAVELCLKRTITLNTSKGQKSKIIFRIFPHKAITKKPAETRMGKGKGSIDHYVACVRPGSLLVELSNISNDILAKKALKIAQSKLNVQTKIIKK